MTEIFQRCRTFIKYYYYLAVPLSLFRAYLNVLEPVGEGEPLPLILQITGLASTSAEAFFSIALSVSALLLPWFYMSRTLRIAHATALLFTSAYPIPLISLMGTAIVDLSWLSFFWINFIFIFLPASFNSLTSRYRLAGLIYLSILTQALFYFLSGLWKFRLTIVAWSNGDFSNLFVCILSKTQPESVLLTVPAIAGILYWMAAVFLVACLPVAWLRPNYHKLLGLGVFLFHFGVFLVLKINFFPHYFLAFLFFYFSPFSKNWGEIRRVDGVWSKFLIKRD